MGCPDCLEVTEVEFRGQLHIVDEQENTCVAAMQEPSWRETTPEHLEQGQRPLDGLDMRQHSTREGCVIILVHSNVDTSAPENRHIGDQKACL